MKDPREKKLPQWAQQLLEDERVKVALRFPSEPDPAPDFIASQTGGNWTGATPYRGERLFQVVGEDRILSYIANGLYLYRDAAMKGNGKRPSGPFFLELDDARISLRYRIAKRAAYQLLRAEDRQPERG